MAAPGGAGGAGPAGAQGPLLTLAQLAQIIAGMPAPRVVGATRKPDSFESGDSVEWATWRQHIGDVIAINAWQCERAKLEIRAAMKGTAARSVAEIPLGNNVAPGLVTPENLLNLYEAKFMPAAAGQLAQVEFSSAAQAPSDTVLTWHTRLRESFVRAFPLDAANAENNQHLIGRFAQGLLDQGTSRYVLIQQPATYVAALTCAQRVEASNVILGTPGGSKGGVGSLNSMDAVQGAMKCWYCSGAHSRNECDAYKKAAAYFKNQVDRLREYESKDPNRRSRGRGRGRGTGGRGRFQRRGASAHVGSMEGQGQGEAPPEAEAPAPPPPQATYEDGFLFAGN